MAGKLAETLDGLIGKKISTFVFNDCQIFPYGDGKLSLISHVPDKHYVIKHGEVGLMCISIISDANGMASYSIDYEADDTIKQIVIEIGSKKFQLIF